MVIVNDAADREGVRNQWQIEHCRHIAVGVAACGGAVTRGNVTLGHAHLRLVRDVANDTGLRPRAEQGSLGSLQDFDALQVRCIHVEVSAGELTRLVVQIEGDVGKTADRAT